MKYRLRAPSFQLQERIRTWIAELHVADELGNWPQQLMKERGVFLLHGNQAYLWYLAPDGKVFYLDTERSSLAMDPETDPEAALNAVAHCARKHPELMELLPERPPLTPDCHFCKGTGDDRISRCVCLGLGWLTPPDTAS